jgi:hypothetical protein
LANLGGSVNDSTGDDFSLRLAMNGLALYFASNRAGGFGAADLYVTTRDSLDGEWGPRDQSRAGPQYCGLRSLSNAEPGWQHVVLQPLDHV